MMDLRGALGLMDNPSIELDDLLRLDDPCVIFEGEHVDSDRVVSYVYSVGGFLQSRPIRPSLVGGDCIIVQAKDRKEADAMAADGLAATIDLHRDRVRQQAIDRSLNQGIIVNADYRPKQ